MPVGALVGAAASIGGGLLSAGAAKSAANKAAAAQTAAAQAGIAEQRRQYDTTRSDLSPWMSSGQTSQDAMMRLLGLGDPTDWAAFVKANPSVYQAWINDPQKLSIDDYGRAYYQNDLDFHRGGHVGVDGQFAADANPNYAGIDLAPYQLNPLESLKSDPVYQALFKNGIDVTLANASATGGLRGGNAQEALARVGSDTLAGVYNNRLVQLMGISQLGESAAAQTGAFGANSANAISDLLGQQGAAQAGSALAGGAASAGAFKDIAGVLGGLANNKDVQAWVGKLF